MKLFLRGLSTLTRQQREKSVRIGCSSAFWGDSGVSTPQLLAAEPRVDYVVSDFLSEITMSLLARAKAKDPERGGFCPDFLAHVSLSLDALATRRTKLITNAGGLNPVGCAEALRTAAAAKGVTLKVAAVIGDDLSGRTELLKGDVPKGGFVSANAYLGAEPIRVALAAGADIVITGRCVDSALTLGPLMHEFDWALDDLEAMATGSLAGHLLECGAQATGGVFTDWESVADSWHNIGFPIAEFESESAHHSFIVTKPAGTGGKVSVGTVAEQLVYEIGDPCQYLLPDVCADFSLVSMASAGEDRVAVSGAMGSTPPAQLKVTGTSASGFRSNAVCPVIGPKAAEKAIATGNAIIRRCRDIFAAMKLPDFRRTHVQALGSNASYGSYLAPSGSSEVVLWLAVEHSSKAALEIFAREVAPAGTGMAPGLTTSVGGRPRVSPVLTHSGLLVDRAEVTAEVYVDGAFLASVPSTLSSEVEGRSAIVKEEESGLYESVAELGLLSEDIDYRLGQLAWTRSGDKGDTANIGVVARHPALFPVLKHHLTAERVAAFFAHLLEDPSLVRRYELPGVTALNFVLPKALGGGGIASLRPDPQGKAYASMLSELVLEGLPILPCEK